MRTTAMTAQATGRELTSAKAPALAAFYPRHGLDRLATEGEVVHPGVRAHAIAALTQHEAGPRTARERAKSTPNPINHKEPRWTSHPQPLL